MSDHGSELIAIEKAIWRDLSVACSTREHPWRLPVLATVDTNGNPHARTIVLRNVDLTSRRLLLHTDVRSPKIQQLQANAGVILVFYDPATMTQLTIQGTGTVHTTDVVADHEWQNAPQSSRRSYLAPRAPGTIVDQPDHNLPEHVVGRVPTENELADARPNFAVIAVQVTGIDWLKLDRERNTRACFGYLGTEPKRRWVAV